MSGPILKLGFTVALFIGIAIGAGSGPVGLFAVLICVMILGIMWAGAIGEWLGSGFVGAFSGGGPDGKSIAGSFRGLSRSGTANNDDTNPE